MCIRDRLHVEADFDPLPFDATAARTFGSVAASLRSAGRKPCLLYTSDAADERSSVDLGGRRIIKKKNSEDTWAVRASHVRTQQQHKHKQNKETERKRKSRSEVSE